MQNRELQLRWNLPLSLSEVFWGTLGRVCPEVGSTPRTLNVMARFSVMLLALQVDVDRIHTMDNMGFLMPTIS
jgi:hypothetical protein